MGCDYVIEMDLLVIVLIQQSDCRSHVNCSREHSCLRGVFLHASKLITALLMRNDSPSPLSERQKSFLLGQKSCYLISH